MQKGKWRLIAFLTGFSIGLVLFLIIGLLIGFMKKFKHQEQQDSTVLSGPCSASDHFSSPEEILASLKSTDVLTRREIFRRLFLQPGVSTIYYDYERDRDYPERVEQADLKYIRLDGDGADEAILRFVRFENPVALVLKRDDCGWRLAGGLGAWLRYEDFPYLNWLETVEAVRSGAYEILVHESTGDATSYSRRTRVLKLIDGALVQIAEFTEESIKPLEGYAGSDSSNVKLRESTRSTFIPEANGDRARLKLETQEEIVRFSGSQVTYSFWSEVDGAWHCARKHWQERTAERVKLVGTCSLELVWDSRRNRFIEDK
jgi:hypothetical protein